MHRLAEQQVALEAQLGQVVTTVQALTFDTQRRLSALEVWLDPKSVLTEEQAAYINVKKEGPYKPEHYRY